MRNQRTQRFLTLYRRKPVTDSPHDPLLNPSTSDEVEIYQTESIISDVQVVLNMPTQISNGQHRGNI